MMRYPISRAVNQLEELQTYGRFVGGEKRRVRVVEHVVSGATTKEGGQGMQTTQDSQRRAGRCKSRGVPLIRKKAKAVKPWDENRGVVSCRHVYVAGLAIQHLIRVAVFPRLPTAAW